jgi:hypothetical protein
MNRRNFVPRTTLCRRVHGSAESTAPRSYASSGLQWVFVALRNLRSPTAASQRCRVTKSDGIECRRTKSDGSKAAIVCSARHALPQSRCCSAAEHSSAAQKTLFFWGSLGNYGRESSPDALKIQKRQLRKPRMLAYSSYEVRRHSMPSCSNEVRAAAPSSSGIECRCTKSDGSKAAISRPLSGSSRS